MAVKKTRCCYCGKEIGVSVPNRNIKIQSCSCNDCIPENSSARNGIDESIYTEHSIAHRLRKAKECIVKFKAQRIIK